MWLWKLTPVGLRFPSCLDDNSKRGDFRACRPPSCPLSRSAGSLPLPLPVTRNRFSSFVLDVHARCSASGRTRGNAWQVCT